MPVRAQSLKNAAVLSYCTTNSALFKLILSSRDRMEEDGAGPANFYPDQEDVRTGRPDHRRPNHFNPRPRAGGGDGKLCPHRQIRISIHAPARGATFELRTGDDPLIFQSPHPHGERPAYAVLCRDSPDFNPRSPRGERPQFRADLVKLIAISIHAPVRGATNVDPQRFMDFYISIHAPVRGATCVWMCHLRQATISIHAPVRGATNPFCSVRCPAFISIHAPVRGAT